MRAGKGKSISTLSTRDQIIGKNEEKYDNGIRLGRVEEGCLDFCIELLNQYDQGDNYDCAFVCALTVGWRRTTRFCCWGSYQCDSLYRVKSSEVFDKIYSQRGRYVGGPGGSQRRWDITIWKVGLYWSDRQCMEAMVISMTRAKPSRVPVELPWADYAAY